MIGVSVVLLRNRMIGVMRLSLQLVLLILTLVSPVVALTVEETRFLDNVGEYYRDLGMPERSTWLQQQMAKGNISFEKMTGKDAGTSAMTDPLTGHIRVNSATLAYSSYRSVAEAAFTLTHERKHQDQSYLGWVGSYYNQDSGLGNPYEREGWAEGFMVNRRAALTLKKRLEKAKNSHDRLVLAEQLSEVTRIWRVLSDEWKSKRKKEFGEFNLGELTDPDGSAVEFDELDQEMAVIQSKAKDVVVTTKALLKSYQGRYRGSLSGGAVGAFNFQVARDYSIRGSIGGKHRLGPFKGTLEGRVNSDGRVSGKLYGSLTLATGEEGFTGSFQGYINGNKASGSWTGGAENVWPSGRWSANR